MHALNHGILSDNQIKAGARRNNRRIIHQIKGLWRTKGQGTKAPGDVLKLVRHGPLHSAALVAGNAVQRTIDEAGLNPFEEGLGDLDIFINDDLGRDIL